MGQSIECARDRAQGLTSQHYLKLCCGWRRVPTTIGTVPRDAAPSGRDPLSASAEGCLGSRRCRWSRGANIARGGAYLALQAHHTHNKPPSTMLITTTVMLPTIHNMKRSYNNTVCPFSVQQTHQFLGHLNLRRDRFILRFQALRTTHQLRFS